MMALLMKHNSWPGAVYKKPDHLRCTKPSKGAQPDVVVELPSNEAFAFPVPVQHVEIVGKKTVLGEVEFKGWVAALNALAMMPTSYYIEVYHDHWALYRFSRNGKIDVEKKRYEMICVNQEEFGSRLTELSAAILTAMFDILSDLEKICHAQYDLDDIGKQDGKSKSGNNVEICTECFHFDNNTINIMRTQHQPSLSDGPRDEPDDLNTPKASDDETEPFFIDGEFCLSPVCSLLGSVNVPRRVPFLDDTNFLTPSKAGPEGDGASGQQSLSSGPSKRDDRSGDPSLSSDASKHDVLSGQLSLSSGPSKGDVPSGQPSLSSGPSKRGVASPEASLSSGPSKRDVLSGQPSGHDKRGETSEDSRRTASRNLFPEQEGQPEGSIASALSRRNRDESTSTDSSSSSVKQQLLMGQQNKRHRKSAVPHIPPPRGGLLADLPPNEGSKEDRQILLLKKGAQDQLTSFKSVYALSSPVKQEKKNVTQAEQSMEQDDDVNEDDVNLLDIDEEVEAATSHPPSKAKGDDDDEDPFNPPATGRPPTKPKDDNDDEDIFIHLQL